MDRSNTIGGRIEQLRKDKGLTQAELAKAMYVRRETIVQWENGDRDLKTQATISLADFFGVTCDEILRGIKAENVDINKKTGLTANAIYRICAIGQYPSELKALNAVLETDEFESFIRGIVSCMEYGKYQPLFEQALIQMGDKIEGNTRILVEREKTKEFNAAMNEAQWPITILAKRLLDEAKERNKKRGGVDDEKA